MIKEIWKPVAGYPYYEVSNLGRVRTLSRWIEYTRSNTGDKVHRRVIKGQIIKPVPDKDGYVFVGMVGYGRRKNCIKYVHRMVARAFIGKPPPGKKLVMHLDDIPANNWVTNLQWGSHMDNVRDRDSKSRQARGSRNGFAKLTEAEVIQMVTYSLIPAMSDVEVGKIFGVTDANVRLIRNGSQWSHVTGIKKKHRGK